MQRFYSVPRLGALFGLCAALACGTTTAAQRVNWDKLLSFAPSWPIVSVGKPIDDALIDEWRDKAYRCGGLGPFGGRFPSKAGWKDANGDSKWSPNEKTCDDGDATLFNGLLCAVGESQGCDAVARSQAFEKGHAGQWYRSPNRAFLGVTECPKGPGTTTDTERRYCQECVNALSPDMALGIAQYLFKTKDIAAFKRWASWMERNAATTTLKWEGSKPRKFTWPRLCDLDAACTVGGKVVKGPTSGGLPVSSGACFLLPNVAMDFEYLDTKLQGDWGPTMRNALVASKHLKATVLITAAAATGTPPMTSPMLDIVVASKDEGYVIHLDAVRVLLKMIAVNPDLKYEQLPPIPSSTAAFAGPFDAGKNEDPLVSHALATQLAGRQKWNPFFKLLAEGATPGVRDQILKVCPQPGATPGKQDTWLWNSDLKAAPEPGMSMGWDCVFVARLYNKMRVPQDIRDELFRKFDPVNRLLGDAAAAVEQLRTQAAQGKAAMDAADAALRNAKNTVDSHTASARSGLMNGLAEHQNAHLGALARSARDGERLAGLAPCPGDFHPIERAACKRLKKELNDTIATFDRAAAAALQQANSGRAAVVRFDQELQTAQTQLSNGALESDVKLRRSAYKELDAALARGEKKLVQTRQQYGRAAKYLGVWKGEAAST